MDEEPADYVAHNIDAQELPSGLNLFDSAQVCAGMCSSCIDHAATYVIFIGNMQRWGSQDAQPGP